MTVRDFTSLYSYQRPAAGSRSSRPTTAEAQIAGSGHLHLCVGSPSRSKPRPPKGRRPQQPQSRILPGCQYHIQLLRSQKGQRPKVPFTSPSQMSPNLTITPRNLSRCFLPSITDGGSGQVGPSCLGASLVQPAPRAAQSRLHNAVCSSNSRWPRSVQLGSKVLPTPRPSATAHPATVSSAAAPPRG